MSRSMLLTATLLASLASLSNAQDWSATERARRITDGLSALSHMTQTPWQVVWSEASRTPKAVYGPGLRVASGVAGMADAQELGSQVLGQHADLLGWPAAGFEVVTHARVNETYVLVYQQRYRRLRVLDGRADVRLHESGVVSMLGAEAFPVAHDLDLVPRLRRAEAAELARRFTTADAAAEAGELLIWACRKTTDCRPRLAWEVRIDSATNPGLAYVDALDGTLIQFRPTRHSWRHSAPLAAAGVAANASSSVEISAPAPMNITGTLMAYVADGPGPNGPLVNRPLSGALVQVQGGGSSYTDAGGNFSIPATTSVSVSVTVDFSQGERLGSLTPTQGTPLRLTATMTPGIPRTLQLLGPAAAEFDVAQTTAFHLTDRVARYVRQAHILGNDPALAGLDQLAITVNDQPFMGQCNAAFSPGRMLFSASIGGAGGCPNMAFSTVVEHEWGHALDFAFGGIGDSDLAEGWADTVANFFTGQPLIGENFLGPGQHVRDATNTAQYPNGPAHQGGLVWMGGNWKLRQALITAMGATAGRDHAETLVLGSLTANASSIVDALRELYILDDNDGNLNNGTPNCQLLFDAFTVNHNIPAPVTSCSSNPGIVTPYGSGCPGSVALPPVCLEQNVSATASGLIANAPPGFRLAYGVTAAQALSITSVELFTRGGSGQLALHRSAGGMGPASSPLATATLSATGTAGWRAATFAAPVTINAGETFYLIHDAASFDVSLLGGGTPPAVPTLMDPGFGFFVPISLQGIPDQAAWRITCTGSGGNATPVLSTRGVPTTGQSFDLLLDQALPNASAFLLLGTSRTTFQQFTLPLDLGFLGAPGCEILASWDVMLAPFTTDAAGQATIPMPVPNLPGLVDAHVYTQMLIIDPQANALGVATTRALDLEIGVR